MVSHRWDKFQFKTMEMSTRKWEQKGTQSLEMECQEWQTKPLDTIIRVVARTIIRVVARTLIMVIRVSGKEDPLSQMLKTSMDKDLLTGEW